MKIHIFKEREEASGGLASSREAFRGNGEPKTDMGRREERGQRTGLQFGEIVVGFLWYLAVPAWF